MGRRHYYYACLVLTVGLDHAVGAQSDIPADRVSQIVSEAATRLGQRSQPRQFDLTLDDAIRRALERNLDIAVQRITPQVFDLTLAEQLAFYRPTVSEPFMASASAPVTRS